MSRKTLAPSCVTSRDPKGQKFVSIVEAAYNKARLTDEEAQRINNAAGLSELVSGFIAEHRTTDKFKNEEVSSNYGYFSGYKPKGKLSDLNTQANCLRFLFPGVGYYSEDFEKKINNGEVELPEGAEGWFAIPNWQKNPKIFGTTYSQAVQKVLDTLKETCGGKFENYREGGLNEARLHQSAQTEKFFRELAEAQGNPDILIVPAQFGFHHRGRSVRRAREVFGEREFGLGAFAVGIMLLTHPERLRHYDDLYIDCAGDEYDYPASDVRFDYAPYFHWYDGLEFDASRFGSASDFYGSASGFLPQ